MPENTFQVKSEAMQRLRRRDPANIFCKKAPYRFRGYRWQHRYIVEVQREQEGPWQVLEPYMSFQWGGGQVTDEVLLLTYSMISECVEQPNLIRLRFFAQHLTAELPDKWVIEGGKLQATLAPELIQGKTKSNAERKQGDLYLSQCLQCLPLTRNKYIRSMRLGRLGENQ